MLSMLIAYNAAGDVVATQDSVIARDADGDVIGLYDFAAHEAAGGKLRDVGNVSSSVIASSAVGSATWPEWLGGRVYDFRVELDTMKRIKALVHKGSGHRRERQALEDAIAQRIDQASGAPADLRDLLGRPGRPLILDEEGKTARPRTVERPELPVILARRLAR